MVVDESRLSSGSSADFSSISEDVLPDADATRDIGSDAKRWLALYAVLAVVGSISIGGILLTSNMGELQLNGSMQINGSLEVLENITAAFYYGDGSKLTGLAGGGDITEVNTPGTYLYGGAISGAINIQFNETELNDTIDARDTDTDTTYTNESFNLASIPGSITENNISDLQHVHNSSQNLTLQQDVYACFGNCSAASITFNGTTLRIQVN